MSTALRAAGDRIMSIRDDGIPGRLATGLLAGARLLWQVPPEALRVRRDPPPTRANASMTDLGRVVSLTSSISVVPSRYCWS